MKLKDMYYVNYLSRNKLKAKRKDALEDVALWAGLAVWVWVLGLVLQAI